MVHENSIQHSKEDPRVIFATGIIEELRGLLLHDNNRRGIQRIRVSIDLETHDDEIHLGWGKSFPRA